MTFYLPLITEFNLEIKIYYCLTQHANRFEVVNR